MIHVIPIDGNVHDAIKEFNARFGGDNKKFRLYVHDKYLFVTEEEYDDSSSGLSLRGMAPNLLTDQFKRGGK